MGRIGFVGRFQKLSFENVTFFYVNESGLEVSF